MVAADTQTLRKRHLIRKFCLVFIFAMSVWSILAGLAIRRSMADERLAMEQALLDECLAIKNVFGELLFKTQVLGTFVEQNNGNLMDFHSIAADLVDSSVIAGVLAAPGGVVAAVYPLAGNEKLLGYSLLGEGAGTREAITAKESNTMIVSGPFPLIQGEGLAIASWLPASLYLEDGGTAFWGIVSVVLKYPEVLEKTRLQTLTDRGLAYTLSHRDPETDERKVLAQSGGPLKKGVASAERRIRIISQDWYLKVSRVQAWHENPANWSMGVAALALSLLAASIVTGNDMARDMKEELKEITHTDQLTGLLNRKGVFLELKKMLDRKERFRFALLDLSHFKQINSICGYTAGDYALREFAERVRNRLGEGHIFARTDGTEFIIAHKGKGPEDASLWEELNLEFQRPVSPGTCEDFLLRFTRGEAAYPDDGDTLDAIMAHADNALREEKRKRYATEKGRRAEDREPSA